MKAVKIAGLRLVNYLNDGINWKDHKDIVLDFWIKYKSTEFGYSPRMFLNIYTTDEMPTQASVAYQKWFEEYNFQNEIDSSWLEFVNGTLNLLYRTSNPTLMDESVWYMQLLKSEEQAREIVETQIFHGDPNLNSFWKLETNTKPDEVGGRRNGYMYTKELNKILPSDTKNFYWGIIFTCIETVKLFYRDGNVIDYRCINWAANADHMTLVKILPTGRMLIQQTFVPGKAWKVDRYLPQSAVPKHPLTGSGLDQWIKVNYYDMYGIWDKWDEATKNVRESINARKNAVNTLNDEEVKLSNIVRNVDSFIASGNVPEERRKRNRVVREAVREKNKIRDREIRKRMREIQKAKNKQDRRDRSRLNPFTK